MYNLSLSYIFYVIRKIFTIKNLKSMDTLFRWGKMHCMQKALFVLLSVVLVACRGEEKVNLSDEPEAPEAEITLAEGTDKHPLLDASGGTVTLHFTSTADWKATVGNVRASSWITVSPTSGKVEKHRSLFRLPRMMVQMSVLLLFFGLR